MGLIEDISRFLETRLEEYIRTNPQIELQALDEKLRQQEFEVNKLIVEFRSQEKQLQDKILSIAEEIKLWHSRAQKATEAGRQDLASAANEREAALLRQGNQVWGQMELIKERLKPMEPLHSRIKERQQEVKAKLAEAEKSRPRPEPTPTFKWENLQTPSNDPNDPLEQKFQRWEMDEELERLKRKMGR